MINKKKISIKKQYRIFYFGKYCHSSFVKEFKNLKEANKYVIDQHIDLVGIEEERRGF